VGQVPAVGVEVVDLGQVRRLVLAPVDDQQLVPVGDQLLDHGGADEPGPAQHHDPHPCSLPLWPASAVAYRRGQVAVTAGTGQT
jgi:hypothetical protein